MSWLLSPQRKFLLPGAQRAPRGKSAPAPSGPSRSPGANYRRPRARSFQKASLRGAELENTARTIKLSSGPGEPELARGPKAGFLSSSPQSRPGGRFSAAPPNFRVTRRGTRATGAIAALAVNHSGQARPVWPWTRAIQQCAPVITGSLGGGHERLYP